MAINVNTLAPASLKSKNVATVNSSLALLAASEEARDGLIDTFYQTSAPTIGMSYGDYLVDTDDVSYTNIQYSCRIQYNKMFKIFDIAISNMSDSNSNSSIIKEPYYNLLYLDSFTSIKVVQDILNKF